jgi:hypothetical protein
MIGARPSGMVIILVLATACRLVGAAAQPPEASETLGSPEAGPSGPKASEPNLASFTLTPQRMQSIGVKTGIVERRKVQDEIRTVGNVEADETRLADVQVRFRRSTPTQPTRRCDRASRFSPSTAQTWSLPSRNIWWPKNS